MAFGMPATQTGVLNAWDAGKAVDGNIDEDYNNYHCSHTSTNRPAEWEVTFAATIVLLNVTVFNRLYCCEYTYPWFLYTEVDLQLFWYTTLSWYRWSL